jgi:threonine synthase
LRRKSTLKQGSSTVVLITGSGLKDIDAAGKKVEFPHKAIESLKEI